MAKSILAKNKNGRNDDWLEEYEGQLAIDVYETAESLVVTAPIAGVSPDNLDVQVSEEYVTIRGERQDQRQADATGYHIQECYWGPFSRTFEVPFPIDTENAQAVMKNGILTIVLPKLTRSKARSIKVQTD